MGGKSSSTTGPSKLALPHLNTASGALDSAYGQSSALANQAVNTLQANLPTVLGQTFNNPTLGAANNYTQAVLSGNFLNSNPFFDQMIANSNSHVADKVNSAIGTRGLTGGSAQTQLLGRQLAENETAARAAQYNTERGYQQNAAGTAASLSAAGNQNLAGLLAYLSGTVSLPQSVASQYAGGTNSLWGDSTTTTQKQSLGTMLSSLAGSGLAGWAAGGFKL